MYTLQLNERHTRHTSISEEHLKTIQTFYLFENLTDSNGYITEDVLNKLRETVKSLILTVNNEQRKSLIDFCCDVLYHTDMKALGLKNLIAMYEQWQHTQHTSQKEDA